MSKLPPPSELVAVVAMTVSYCHLHTAYAMRLGRRTRSCPGLPVDHVRGVHGCIIPYPIMLNLRLREPIQLAFVSQNFMACTRMLDADYPHRVSCAICSPCLSVFSVCCIVTHRAVFASLQVRTHGATTNY